jgi:hypothetical protein
LGAVSRLSMQEGQTAMINTARNITTGLAVTFVFASAAEAVAAGNERLRIVLHVDNYAGISPAERSATEVEVTRIYIRAGVNILWATGDDQADAAGLHVRVQLLSRSMAIGKINRDGLIDTVLGKAAREAGRAYIFTDRILNLAVREGEPFRLALGRVIAHEVGHLLLPPHSHSERGIMRASTFVRSNGSYDFTTEQGVAIRSMLLAASYPHATEIAEVGPR